MALTTSVTCCYVQSTSNSRNFYSLPPVSLIRYPIRRCPHHFAGAYSAAVREVGKTCLAYDNAAGSTEGLDADQLELQDYINSSSADAARTKIGSSKRLDAALLELQDIINSPTVDEARKKIDDFALRNRLKSKMMAKATKAWLSPKKETNMTKDEVYEVMRHLLRVAASQHLKRKEIEILKHLLTIEDPEERMCALKDAFTPGSERKGEDEYFFYTTPETLNDVIGTVVKAYTTSSKDSTQVKEIKDFMNPETIQNMEELKKEILDNLMTPETLDDVIGKAVKAYTTSSKDSTRVKEIKDFMNPETIQTPETPNDMIGKVVKAYTTSSKDSTRVKEIRDFMNPETIQKMEELKKVILDNFM